MSKVGDEKGLGDEKRPFAFAFEMTLFVVVFSDMLLLISDILNKDFFRIH